MPSVVPHIVAPLLFALAFLPVERWRAWAWAPLVFAPDLDFFFAVEYHRAALSNIFIPLALAAAIVVLWQRRDPMARLREFACRPGAPANLFLALFYVSSHILMDVFAGGVVLFWPLSNVNVFWFLQILVATETGEVQGTSDPGTEPGIPEITPVFEWFSPIDAAVLAFVLVGLLGWFLLRRRNRVVVIERESVLAEPIHKE